MKVLKFARSEREKSWRGRMLVGGKVLVGEDIGEGFGVGIEVGGRGVDVDVDGWMLLLFWLWVMKYM